jgi:thiamine biosynthesis lipoprotein
MSKTSTETAAPALARIALSGPTMGSRWTAVAFVPPGFDTGGLERGLQDAVDAVDGQMSTWKPDSDLNRLNAAPVGEWVPVPAALATVLVEALAIGEASGGAFDIGVGDLVVAFGFGGGRRTPDPDLIGAAASRPAVQSHRALQVDRRAGRARKLAPLTLDLSGIAKGFGVDELGRVMTGAGLASWLVGIDGEMRAAGCKPDGCPWLVGHEKADPAQRALAGVLELRDAAVATSGTYRHTAEWNGRTVSHTMDPRSGAPIGGELASVTVVAPDCMAADAWATALMVAGPERSAALARAHGLSYVMALSDGTVQTSL